jgi:hypothetical protein
LAPFGPPLRLFVLEKAELARGSFGPLPVIIVGEERGPLKRIIKDGSVRFDKELLLAMLQGDTLFATGVIPFK